MWDICKAKKKSQDLLSSFFPIERNGVLFQTVMAAIWAWHDLFSLMWSSLTIAMTHLASHCLNVHYITNPQMFKTVDHVATRPASLLTGLYSLLLHDSGDQTEGWDVPEVNKNGLL